MLTKTDKTKNGKVIYVNEWTGQEGTLAEQTFKPSERRSNRDRTKPIPKVTTNSKPTKGRRIYMQVVNKIVGKDKLTGKLIKEPTKTVIKHIQETPNAISRKIALLNFNEKVLVAKSKWYEKNPEFKAKAK